jgi:hypothetical protein
MNEYPAEPTSVDDARSELAEIDEWMKDLQARQQAQVTFIARAGMLNGYLLRDKQEAERTISSNTDAEIVEAEVLDGD